MSLLTAALLGLLQGVTEFIPVSSKGHLLAARLLFGISDTGGLAFDMFLHLGTLTAVLVYYWRVWFGMLRAVVVPDAEGKDKRQLAGKLLLATIPAALVGYFLQDIIGEKLRSGTTLAIGFFVTALLLCISDYVTKKRMAVPRASWRDALFIGIAQILALAPGVSRSGTTISAGRWRGLSRHQATTFSFLMSAPIIAGAGLNGMISVWGGATFAPAELLVGFLVALVSGFCAIYLLLKWVDKMSFTPLIWYLVALGTIVLIYG